MELLDKKAIRELEKFIKDEIERVVFDTRRSKAKVNGGHEIEDDTGKLRRSIRANRNFIKQTNKGIEIELRAEEYYKYLDDERRDELNWYLTEAIFEDDKIRKKLKDIYAKSAKRVILKEIKSSL